MPNFKKLAKNYEKPALETLKGLVAKKSVYDASSVSEDAPYGTGVKSALDYLAKLGKDNGFKVDTCDGHVTEISIGNGQGPVIGIYAHADVVPATGKWSTKDPFKAELVGEGKEAKLIARGTSDDKGPLVAAFYAAKLLSDAGLVKNYSIRFCAGGDEERGSSCLDYYFHTLKKTPTDYGFTPDADFPLIYAEKGMVSGCRLVKKVDLTPIIAMDGGVVSNAVCDRFLVTLPHDEGFEKAFEEKAIKGEITRMGPVTLVVFSGTTSHGSTPEKGVNAALKAFEFIGAYYKNEFLTNLAKVLADCNGRGFEGFSSSPELGLSTFNYGVIHYDGHEKLLNVSVDYRYGEKADPKLALENLEKHSGMKVECKGLVSPLLYAKDSPLVKTLMKSYKRTTFKLFDKPMAIGGGTYAKEAPNCVAYGSAFKGHPGDIHSPNEYIYLDDFFRQIYIYADAIASLGALPKQGK